MPHVSSKKLDKTVSKRLWNQLTSTLKDAGKRSAIDGISNELFTYTEKIMFAKRLAIILLLDKGLPQHVISDELKVSTSTVTRISLGIDTGKYKTIFKVSGKEGILDILEKVILMGMPPRVGRGRWNHWGRFTP